MLARDHEFFKNDGNRDREVGMKAICAAVGSVLLILVSISDVSTAYAALAPHASLAQPMPRISRPEADKGPTKVYGGMWLIDIDSIDSSAQNFVANVFTIFRWKDPRLADPAGQPRIYKTDEIWNPGIQIANEIGIVRRTFPEVVEVEPDGTATYRQRFVGPFSQPLDLNAFPFDTQKFRLHVLATGNKPEDVQFVRDQAWIDSGLPKAAGIAKDISLPDWHIVDYDTVAAPYVVGPKVKVPGFAFDFTARRDKWHYIWKVILPLLLIVMMSWSVFWIDPSNAGTQIAVATTSMLTLIAYRFAVDTQVPKVPYMTKMDQFIVMGTVLVFLTLMQVVLTARLTQLGKKALAHKIDRLSRWVFPAVFIVALSLSLVE